MDTFRVILELFFLVYKASDNIAAYLKPTHISMMKLLWK